MSIYRGFSTVGKRHKFRLTDFELAKQDLINHFHIRKGERVMNPDFGTSIWSMLFENMTQEWHAQVVEEIQRVASYDPRLSLLNINIVEFDRGIQVELDMLYTGDTTPVKLLLAFEAESQTVTEL
jgi:phage baseplate assembly protein W